jgi:hypothetical protein
MSTVHPHQRNRPDAEPANHSIANLAADGAVSTRILLDSGSQPSCHACGDSIELNARHKCLTVRDDAGAREFCFCDEDCLGMVRDQ